MWPRDRLSAKPSRANDRQVGPSLNKKCLCQCRGFFFGLRKFAGPAATFSLLEATNPPFKPHNVYSLNDFRSLSEDELQALDTERGTEDEKSPSFESLSDEDEESSEAPNNAPSSGQQFLESLIVPRPPHVNDVSNFCRLIYYNTSLLVIALDDSGDATSQADI